MERAKLIKLIGILVAVLLLAAVVAAIIIWNSGSGADNTEPSGSNPLQGEIIPGTMGTDDPTSDAAGSDEQLPTGDVGVGIWDETDPTDSTGESTGTTEPEPSGSVDVGIWTDPTEESTQPTSQPTEPTTQPTQPVTPPADGELTWEQYLALDSQQRYEYYLTFESMDAFFVWKNAAEAKYEAENPIPTIDGSIDLGDLIGG